MQRKRKNMMGTCIWCKGKLRDGETDIEVNIAGEVVIFPGIKCKICSECGEKYYDADSEQQKHIDEITHRLHTHYKGLHLRRKLSRSGGTLLLRIPRDVEREYGLNENIEVEISAYDKKKIVVEVV